MSPISVSIEPARTQAYLEQIMPGLWLASLTGASLPMVLPMVLVLQAAPGAADGYPRAAKPPGFPAIGEPTATLTR